MNLFVSKKENMENYKGVIAIVLNDKDEVLVGKKVEKPGYFLSNEWHIPGGKINPSEDPEEALKREMREELGVELKINYLLCDFPLKIRDQTYLSACYVCEQVDPSASLKPGDDLQDAKYVDKKELVQIHYRKAMQNWPQEMKDFLGVKRE